MKAKYLIPNLFTTANMACGFNAILASYQGQTVHAAWSILAAGIFDLCDGRIARTLKASTSFGEVYDTLSDLVSFGLAPAFLLYQSALGELGNLGWALSFFYLIAVALRLARFSLSTTEGSSRVFQGLSSPVGAATAAAFALFTAPMSPSEKTAAIAVALILPALMVSSIPFPTFKKTRWKSAPGIAFLAGTAVVGIACIIQPRTVLFPTISGFVLVAMSYELLTKTSRTKLHPLT